MASVTLTRTSSRRSTSSSRRSTRRGKGPTQTASMFVRTGPTPAYRAFAETGGASLKSSHLLYD
jgi:hypothetical protein